MGLETRTSSAFSPVSLFIFSFAAGIFFSSFIFVSPLASLFLAFLALAICAGEKIHKGRVEREALFIALALLSFGLGALRYAVKDFHEAKVPSFHGVVVSEPEDKEDVRRFVYQADNGEKALVSAPLYTDVLYGDRVEVKGNLKKAGVIEDESGRSFDYGAYLSKDGIYWTESFASVKVLTHGQGSPIKAALLKIKNNFIAHIDSILPEPSAGLLAGLIVAGKGSLPPAIVEEFRRAGVIHIVVLSGYNVTLIAEFLRKLFRRLFAWMNYARFPHAPDFAALLGILLFVIMTGAEATVVRAALMASVAILARFLGRSFSASRALLFAAFLMLLGNPKLLVFDPSFQLSFLATFGLMCFMEPVEKKLQWVTERWKMRENLSQTLATQLAVLPLLVYSTGQLSIVSIPANLLILPLVPLTMLVGFAATLLSYLGWLAAWPLALVSHVLLSYLLLVPHLLSSLPFAIVHIPL